MATIKSYTDLPQSKKLAEILPLESADMHYHYDYVPWLSPDEARRAVEIAKEEIYEWLRNNSEKYVYWMDEEFGKDDLINDLKQAMKDE